MHVHESWELAEFLIISSIFSVKKKNKSVAECEIRKVDNSFFFKDHEED